MTPRQQTALVALGDCAVFFIFALLGLRNHDEGITLNGIVRNAVPFGAAWLLFAWLHQLYGRGWALRDDAPWQRVASAWLPAWLLGVILRSVYVWRWPVPAFASVVLITLGIMLVLWRMLAAWLLKRSRVTA